MKRFLTLSTTLKTRLLADFILIIASQAILPFLALYLTSKVNAVFAGVFLITNLIVSFIVSFIGGYIGDNYNRKKVVNYIHFLYAICLIILSITVTMDGIGLVIFCITVFIFEIMFAASEPIFEAAIMDAIYEEVREYVYQLNYWMFNISTAIGMVLGALLYLGHKRLLFVIFFLAMLISWYLFEKYYDVEQVYKQKEELTSKFKDFINSYHTVIKDKYFMMLNLGFMLVIMAELSLNSYVVVRLKSDFEPLSFFGFYIDGVRMFTVIMIINTLVVATLTFTVNRIVESTSKRIAFILGIILYTIGYSVLTSASSFWILCLFSIIATLGELIYSPIQNAQRFLMIPDDKRSTYNTFGMISFYGGNLLARSGLIIGAFVLPWMMSVYVAIVVLIGFVLLYYALFCNPNIETK
ncbi:MFS transporter [Staphylococcus xylosus]|uniref:MFS transporter n=2 Tax=Staphylococcus xylosus TaxID=1288 RepID=UPI000499EA09|nr:MFS transporter [Staphylococcus xylosus]AID43225.1 integral membrane protein LmrP [Staphylococcus xylosus]MBE6179166.1 MFS transporter [Staphylococcus xylosus]MCE4994847.1 MFS transporter [Staphylococcus xylosus]MEB6320156.1 MFS transporter [Staphylococcus xylosus]MEB8305792.1 MFS transporter [Staphylococcus xylosus]